jgi:iron(III) transport system ATP-binding protein
MLTIEQLSKRFGETAAVSSVSLQVGQGEFLTLLGPSGCGKTTTLRLIAGFETPDAGRIVLGGRDITTLPPQRRDIGMVFQNYALFPHLNVHENVAFGLKARGVARGDIAERVDRALELVDLGGYGRRRVQQLSGGQQQRVALARALAPEPPVLLLDEPLSNLDAALRERTRYELRLLLERLRITTVFVTHDQEEAFALSDRIALMNASRLEQLGTPEALYAEPSSAFAASFLGRANFLPARVELLDEPFVLCRLAGGALWRARLPASQPALAAAAAGRLATVDANYTATSPAPRAPTAASGHGTVSVQSSPADSRLPASGSPVRLMVLPAQSRSCGYKQARPSCWRGAERTISARATRWWCAPAWKRRSVPTPTPEASPPMTCRPVCKAVRAEGRARPT